MSDAEFDAIATHLRDDQMMTLLSLFEDQVVLIIEYGRPNLPKFLASLGEKGVLLPSEVDEARPVFGFEEVRTLKLATVMY